MDPKSHGQNGRNIFTNVYKYKSGKYCLTTYTSVQLILNNCIQTSLMM